MRAQPVWIGIGAGAAVLAVVAAWLWFGWQQQVPVPHRTPSGPPKAVTLAQPPASQRTDESPAPASARGTPPWLAPQSGRAPSPTSKQEHELARIQARLAQLSTVGKADPREVDGLLAELQRIKGNEVAGVNIAALRDNLAKAQEIQRLAEELNRMAHRPNPDPQQVQDLVARIQRVQAGMRLDVAVPQAAGARAERK